MIIPLKYKNTKYIYKSDHNLNNNAKNRLFPPPSKEAPV